MSDAKFPTDAYYLIRRLAMLLDAALEDLDRAAERERRAETGKPMRQITKQQRAEAARKAVAEADEYLCFDGFAGLGQDDGEMEQ